MKKNKKYFKAEWYDANPIYSFDSKWWRSACDKDFESKDAAWRWIATSLKGITVRVLEYPSKRVVVPAQWI